MRTIENEETPSLDNDDSLKKISLRQVKEIVGYLAFY
jgi:hypothetical protein